MSKLSCWIAKKNLPNEREKSAKKSVHLKFLFFKTLAFTVFCLFLRRCCCKKTALDASLQLVSVLFSIQTQKEEKKVFFLVDSLAIHFAILHGLLGRKFMDVRRLRNKIENFWLPWLFSLSNKATLGIIADK